MHVSTHSKLLQTNYFIIALPEPTNGEGVACFHGMVSRPCREYMLPIFHLRVKNANGSKVGANNNAIELTYMQVSHNIAVSKPNK
jgi:hypothetical protein